MQHTVSIVIPNWNGKELLAKNLPAVIQAAQNLHEAYKETIIVDDGSTDGSVAFVTKSFPSLSVLSLDINRGFQTAVNYGVQSSKGSIVILLNTDIEPHPRAFVPFVRHFDDPLLFGVSGRIYSADKKTFLYGNRGGYFKWGHFYLYEKSEFDTSQTLFICGGAGAFSREHFLSLGGFDTLFHPFYYEEQDISYRALKRGLRLTYEPESIMYHQVRGSIAKKKTGKQIRFISARNNYLFVIKNITDPRYTFQAIICIPLFLIKDLFRLKFRFWAAFSMALPRIPSALMKRFKEQRFIQCTDKYVLLHINSIRE